MSMSDSAEYWFYSRFPRNVYLGPHYTHIGNVCEHYGRTRSNVLTSKYLNDVDCPCCKRLIEQNGNIYGLIEGISPTQQSEMDKEKHRFRYGKCSCGSPMTKRINKATQREFLGCTSYPKCKNTHSI